jgi:hypothetical protein
MTRISHNFTLEELYASNTAAKKGIDNTPGEQEVINLTYLVARVLQPLRTDLGIPITISSGYRSPQLNNAVSGAKNSQHLTGQAADIAINGDIQKGRRIFEWIKKRYIFDQLIWEHNKAGVYWIHVSYNAFGANRGQVIEDLLKKQ